MTNLTLKQLRYFKELARHGHFGRASESAGVSQPALSVQIKELEATLGKSLFERGARGVKLTNFGIGFAQRVNEVLRAVDELTDFARLTEGGLSGTFRLGIIPTIAPYLLPQLMTHMIRAYPALDLQVRETITPKLVHELHEGDIDAAIVALPTSEPGFTEVSLFKERFVLIRPLADAQKPVPDNKTLATMRLLLLEEGHCFRDQALSFCSMGRGQPREGLDGSSLATLVQLVNAGMGVTLIPEMAVAVETKSANVAVDHMPEDQPAREIALIWRKTNPMAEALTELADLVRLAGLKSR